MPALKSPPRTSGAWWRVGRRSNSRPSVAKKARACTMVSVRVRVGVGVRVRFRVRVRVRVS